MIPIVQLNSWIYGGIEGNEERMKKRDLCRLSVNGLSTVGVDLVSWKACFHARSLNNYMQMAYLQDGQKVLPFHRCLGHPSMNQETIFNKHTYNQKMHNTTRLCLEIDDKERHVYVLP